MAEIKMSIIVPAYNAEKYLERCLDSLVNQDLSTKEYEVIVINDGSTDRTGAILHEYSNRYSYFHCITVEIAVSVRHEIMVVGKLKENIFIC